MAVVNTYADTGLSGEEADAATKRLLARVSSESNSDDSQ
jgi:hypothetical protein